MHPTIAVEAETGALLGLVHAELLKHEGGKRASRKQRAIQDKESQRWLTGSQVASELSEAGAARVTPEERRQLENKAAGMSLGGYIRACLFGGNGPGIKNQTRIRRASRKTTRPEADSKHPRQGAGAGKIGISTA